MAKEVAIADLLRVLLCATEKAATVARKTRQESSLFELLIQEKIDSQKNTRFLYDFKTLADVLIQEMLRHDLETKFPGLSDRVFGEENNSFTNTAGRTIQLQLAQTLPETIHVLETICNGHVEAANLLGNVAHSNVDDYLSETLQKDVSDYLSQQHVMETVALSDFALWIDPIDSTFEYIHGSDTQTPREGLSHSGLANVTVLVGVFYVSTGLPFLGILNQPFSQWNAAKQQYESQVFWGFYDTSGPDTETKSSSGHRRGSILCHLLHTSSEGAALDNCLVTSAADIEELRDVVQRSTFPHYQVLSVPGAGYKFLAVIQGLVDAYILLKPNVFAWDTCGPHAILLSRGGGLLRLNPCLEALKSAELASVNDVGAFISKFQVTYRAMLSNGEKQDFCHRDGLIAYRDKIALWKVLQIFKSSCYAV